MKRLLFVLLFPLLFLSSPTRLHAQMPTEPWITWDEFISEYAEYGASDALDAESNGGAYALSPEEADWLETMATHPMQINRVSRPDLLQLPFLDGSQADSIMAYREHRRGFLSMGELSMVNGLDYTTRRWLSLFLRCDSLLQGKGRTYAQAYGQRWKNGQHEVVSRADIPLYRRQGFKTQDRNTASNHFMGNPIRHLLRYRYNEKRETMWGLTAEKDAGEPVGKQGFYPYDYLSAYVFLRPKDKKWSGVVGDFEMNGGRGLVWGKPLFGGREQLAGRMPRTEITFRPHTSTDESRFFRGAAASFAWKGFRALAFVSYRKLDARMDDDTARTLLTTGLHRTMNEIDRRRTLGCFTSGTSVAWLNHVGGISLNGNFTHYDHPIWPEERTYNKDYFRGSTSVQMSTAYDLRFGHWYVQGELAFTQKGRLATDHVVSYRPSARLKASLQVRHYDARYHSPYGRSLQQGSRVSNEDGLLLGVCWKPQTDWIVYSSLDAFRFIHPTYTTVLPHAQGLEWSIRTAKKWGDNHLLNVRYKIKSRQYTITGHQMLEYRTTQRLSVGNTFSLGKCQLDAASYLAYASRQTGQQDWGEMLSLRLTCRPSERWQLKCMGAWFHTSNYASAVYVYEPDVLQSGFSTAFAHHGVHLLAMAHFRLLSWVEAAVRVSSTRYFDQKTQSSGVMAIDSPWKNDVTLLLRFKW